MELNSLKGSSVKRQPRKRVGRGKGNNWGRTCGRGEKGQKSRSGYSRKSHFEGGQIPLIRRIPKKGFKSRAHKSFALVNIVDLEKHFEAGDTVTFEALFEKRLVSALKSGLKILGTGDLSKSLTVKAHAFSETAKNKIESAGGSIELLPMYKVAAEKSDENA